MNRIRTSGIRKDFFSLKRGKITALKGVDLEIEAGSLFVLLGPSGCGKSTLLNIVAGIERPTAGEVVIGNRTVVSSRQKIFLTPRQRDVAMVFQSYALYPHMSVFDNIAFPLKLARLSKSEIRERVGAVAVTLEIDRLLQARPRELSGGQRQRVALGRAVVRRPNVLLLDEPLSNLDALLRTGMRAELKQIQRNLQVTTVYVTHDQIEAMSLGDRIAVMAAGEIQQVAKPEEIYHDPANLFVARFVGSPPLNLLAGDRFFGLLLGSGIAPPPARASHLGIRPEHLVVAREGGELPARLNLISTLGSEVLLHMTAGGQEVIARAPQASPFREGEDVTIRLDHSRIMWFSKEGERIRQR